MQLGPSLRTVELAFVFEDGCVKVVPVEWRRGMTVLDALNSASNKPHGIQFHYSEDGRGAFVTEIDDQANDTSWAWVYWVNSESATVGCGRCELKHGDIVRWEFVRFDPTAR